MPKELLRASPLDPSQLGIHYWRGQWFQESSANGLIRARRHDCRRRLMVHHQLVRGDAEAVLDEVRDYYIANPEQAFAIKKRHVRDSTNLPLTEAEVEHVALHGWAKLREAYMRGKR